MNGHYQGASVPAASTGEPAPPATAELQPPDSLLKCGTCKDWFTVAQYTRHPCVEKWKRDRRGR